jgi:glyoxylase-like metal-dependent hydrolase (beta-lactamase superfamily II)
MVAEVAVLEVAPGVHHAHGAHVSWVLVVDGAEVTLVDTGYPGDRDRVIASLRRIGRSPADVAAVVLTHAHPDHVGNAEHLRAAHGIRVWTHEREAAHARGERIEQVSLAALLARAWRRDVLVWGRDVLRLGATRVERVREVTTCTEGVLDVPGRPVVVPTPGHTAGHVALHLPDRGALLVGDALMTGHALVASSGPRLLPSYFNADTARARDSVRLLEGLPAEVVVPGHGGVFRGTPARAVDLALAAS